MKVIIRMDSFRRRYFIANHLFYFNEAKKRIISQFEDIESEAEEASNDWLSDQSNEFDPDRHHPEEFYEAAIEHGVEFGLQLENLRRRTLLDLASSMYFDWDKNLREWLERELAEYSEWNDLKRIWKAKQQKITEFLAYSGWDVRQKTFFTTIDGVREVVNAYKHGQGRALEVVVESHPEYIEDLISRNLDPQWTRHDQLRITVAQLEKFRDAINEFWTQVPEFLTYEPAELL